MEFLNFQEISKVPFKDILDWLAIPYTDTGKELKGERFIVTTAKNLYFNPTGEDKGSCINFVANFKGISLRDSAAQIKKQFTHDNQIKKEIPELSLTYHSYLEQQGISEKQAESYEVGYCSRRSIMAGKIAFKIRDVQGEKVGYVGFNIKSRDWFFPKGFKRDHLYNLCNRDDSREHILTVSPFEAIKLDGIALMALSMTEEQENLLRQYADKITLIHPQPENIVNRLTKFAFVKVLPE